ncbi:MAG: hypothetical protein EBZ50_15115, partial [Alphaproteobacteria bacterium]|nr:hypothetical protein [Alphaproteobacteria bacterium]
MRSPILMAAVDAAADDIEKGLISGAKGLVRRGLEARKGYLAGKRNRAWRDSDLNERGAEHFHNIANTHRGVYGGLARVRALALEGHAIDFDRKAKKLDRKVDRTSRRIAQFSKAFFGLNRGDRVQVAGPSMLSPKGPMTTARVVGRTRFSGKVKVVDDQGRKMMVHPDSVYRVKKGLRSTIRGMTRGNGLVPKRTGKDKQSGGSAGSMKEIVRSAEKKGLSRRHHMAVAYLDRRFKGGDFGRRSFDFGLGMVGDGRRSGGYGVKKNLDAMVDAEMIAKARRPMPLPKTKAAAARRAA